MNQFRRVLISEMSAGAGRQPRTAGRTAGARWTPARAPLLPPTGSRRPGGMTIARPTNDIIPCAAHLASGAVQYAHVAVKKGRRPNGADAAPAPIPTTITEQRPDHIRTRDLAPFFGPGSWPARVRATVRARHAPAATRKLARTPARANGLGQTG